jgi:hypothetical protein
MSQCYKWGEGEEALRERKAEDAYIRKVIIPKYTKAIDAERNGANTSTVHFC